jgi:hypothetical protein
LVARIGMNFFQSRGYPERSELPVPSSPLFVFSTDPQSLVLRFKPPSYTHIAYGAGGLLRKPGTTSGWFSIPEIRKDPLSTTFKEYLYEE